MTVVSIARALGLLAASVILGCLLVARLAGPSAEAGARGWRRRLAWTGGLLAVPLGGAVLVVLLAGGPVGHGGPAVVANAVATALWVGPLLPLLLLPRTAPPGHAEVARGFAARAARAATALALAFAVAAAASVVVVGRAVPGGPPALVGTRYGRLVLAQGLLVGAALVALARARLALRRTRRWGAVARRVVAPLGVSVLALLLGLASLVVAAALVGSPASTLAPIVWPLPYRFAPVLMWGSPGERAHAIVGVEILLAGLLALIAAARLRSWRPLLLAAGIVLSAAGAWEALISLSIDAYPTTYARPAVPDTPASVRRGRDLFLANCAVCHGAGGRGDGPAAARLLQRPADLTSSHTEDHTPGDIFWWVTHGLGLAMPAFGDRLSVDERWEVVHFVRTLPESLPPRAAGRIRDPAS